ncbi:MAG: flagellar biosynthetic protein FliO [Phycisphaerae bacterium]|jgi:flagellar biogenesis protein FliO|nr:flagellar biosynthetic protein FliO [Phycisphaerae bacterium]
MIAMLKQSAAAMLVTAVVLCASAGAQTSRPTTQPTTRGGVTETFRRLVGPSDGNRIEATPQGPWEQWGRTLGALAVVVLLIFVARIMLKRFGPVSGPQRREVLDVLARASVSPRHQLLLVRVGRRVVLVGQGPSSLTTLSEVTDADEVAALIEAVSRVGLKKAVDSDKSREADA